MSISGRKSSLFWDLPTFSSSTKFLLISAWSYVQISLEAITSRRRVAEEANRKLAWQVELLGVAHKRHLKMEAPDAFSRLGFFFIVLPLV